MTDTQPSRPAPRTSASMFRRVVSGLALAGFLLLALAWLIGRILTDRYDWSQWLWWIPTPLVLLALLMLGPFIWFGASPRRTWWRGGWIIAGVSGLLWFAGVEHRILRPATPSVGDLRIIHWNVDAGLDIDVDAFAHPLMTIGADIHITTAFNRLHIQEDITRWLDGARPHRIPPFTILTRHPIELSVPIHTREKYHYLRVVKIDTHAEIGRSLVLLLIDLPSSPTVSRRATAEIIIDALDQIEGETLPDLVIGDFNMPRGSHTIERMFPAYEHAYDLAGRGYGGTYPRSPYPIFHIDHVLAAPQMKVHRYDIIDPEIGRHSLQVVEVSASDRDN